jgi:hypothetical protein
MWMSVDERGNPKLDGWQMMPNYETGMLGIKDAKSLVSCFLFLVLFCCFAGYYV